MASYRVEDQVEGLGRVLSQLDALPRGLRAKHLRKAVSDLARQAKNAAKAGCPRELGILRKSLGTKVKTYRHSGAVVGVVGARQGFRVPAVRRKNKWRPAAVRPSGFANPVFYLHLAELGTGPSPARHGAPSRGFRFLRHAQRQVRPAVLPRFERAVEAALAEAAGKGAA